MSESSGAPPSRKKKTEELPTEEQLRRPAPELGADESIPHEEPENPPDIPDWLLELENKPVVIPFEVVAQETYAGQDRSSQEAGPVGPADEPLQGDLPDWLKQDRKAPAQADKQTAPEDEIPEWLRKGLEDLQAPEKGSETLEESSAQAPEGMVPGGTNIPPVFAQTADMNTWPEPVERKPVGSHPLPSWLEDPDQPEEAAFGDEQSIQPDQPEIEELPEAGLPSPPPPLDIEFLADVRQSLKEDEQSAPPQKRPGLLERMAGPILTSRLIRPDRGEGDQEDETSLTEPQPTASGEEEMGSPEFPAELLTGPAEEFADDALQTEMDSSRPDESILDDWLSEVGDFAIPDVDNPASEPEEDLRREILSDTETAESDSPAENAEKDKDKKPSLRSRFGFRKADDVEEPAISDEQLERRLLVALSAAGVEETPTPTTADASEELESTSSIFQEEEFDLQYVTEYEDEESLFDLVEEEVTPVDLGETEDQWLEARLPADLDQITAVEESELSEVGQSEIDLREVALRDYIEVSHEPEGGPVDIFIDKAIRKFNSFSLAQKLALAALVLLNVGLVIALGIILLLSLFPSRAAAPSVLPTPTSLSVSGPYPVQLILPGGWSFDVKPGILRDGAWLNQGAEWLQGTEISRWIALPWSKQLEAVAVTLQPTDHIELVMSNRDRLKYRIETVVAVPVEKVVDLNRNSPSLLIILANQDSTTRVVVIGSLVSDEETK